MPVDERLDRGGLVAGRLERGDELEVGHVVSLPSRARTEQAFSPARSGRPTPLTDATRIERRIERALDDPARLGRHRRTCR